MQCCNSRGAEKARCFRNLEAHAMVLHRCACNCVVNPFRHIDRVEKNEAFIITCQLWDTVAVRHFDSLLLDSTNDCGHGLESGHVRGEGRDDLAGGLDDASKAQLLLFGGFVSKIHCSEIQFALIMF